MMSVGPTFFEQPMSNIHIANRKLRLDETFALIPVNSMLASAATALGARPLLGGPHPVYLQGRLCPPPSSRHSREFTHLHAPRRAESLVDAMIAWLVNGHSIRWRASDAAVDQASKNAVSAGLAGWIRNGQVRRIEQL
jgi:hypothetical protein